MAWVGLLGGLGLFLLGMAFLTDSLEAALGGRVKAVMRRLTSNRLAAFGTGAVVTAVIQSSSATSLITIGMVGAGLITLSQAIGVLIGSNVGTTATAYLVSLVGLKFSVSIIALPLVGLGGLMRVFARGRGRLAADLLLGFGLLFVGIDFMQDAMADVAMQVDLAAWAGPGIRGAAALVLVGVVLTALMQSSSAAMAVTLAALAGGAIDIRMGAYLVVGQNVGTTITAVIGALGASTDARRTAGAHVVFNLGTGLVAILALPFLLAVAQRVTDDAALGLAVFHTLFNVVGALLFLPLTAVLARWLQRALPSRGDVLTVHLDPSSLRVAVSSREAVRQTIARMTLEALALINLRLNGATPPQLTRRIQALRMALDATQEFLEDARGDGWVGESISAAVKALDHLRNIASDLGDPAPLERFKVSERIRAFSGAYQAHVADIPEVLDAGDPAEVIQRLGHLTKLRKSLRADVLGELAGANAAEIRASQADLEALHWHDRVAWHLRRVLQGWQEMDQAALPDDEDD